MTRFSFSRLSFALILLMTAGACLTQTASSQQQRPGGGGPGGRGGARPAMTVEAVPIATRMMQEIRTLTGSTAALTQFSVSSEAAGQLRQLSVDVGSVVRSGQTIARLDDDDARQQLAQIQADMGVTRAQQQELQISIDLAERELDRTATLFSRKLVAESELDQARASLETSRARLNVTAAQLRQQETSMQQAKLTLGDRQVVARWPNQHPMVVTRKLVEAGATVGANTPLVELADLTIIRVLTPVTEADYARVKSGQSVRLRTDAYPGRVFEGRIARLAPALNPNTRTAEAEIQVVNSGSLLKPGMFMKAELILQTKSQARTVPLEAVIDREDMPKGLFLVEQGKARFVEVTTGIENEKYIEILTPQVTGQVVTLGNHQIKDGGAIKLANASSAGARPSDAPRGTAAPQGQARTGVREGTRNSAPLPSGRP